MPQTHRPTTYYGNSNNTKRSFFIRKNVKTEAN